jgi:hypothetical protein
MTHLLMKDESLDLPRYVFVNGMGDESHAERINQQARRGYEVVSMVLHVFGGALIAVLMKKT